MSIMYIEIKDLRCLGFTDRDIIMFTQNPTAATLVVGEGRQGKGIVPAEHGDQRGSLCMCEHFYLQIQDRGILKALEIRARRKGLSFCREGFFVKIYKERG